MERWVSIRKRKIYRDMKTEVDRALDDYWASMAEDIVWSQKLYATEKLVLKAYRLMKYIRKDLGADNCIDNGKIGETSDAAISFYCLTETSRTSYAEEIEVLEVLSRAAYREMKQLKKIRDEENADIWR